VIVGGAEDPLLPLPAVDAPPPAVELATPDAPHPPSTPATASAQAMPRSLKRNWFNVILKAL
jgi:hypothetical protein